MQIDIELTETIAYSRRGERFEALCQACDAVAEFATPQIAAIVGKISEREVCRLIVSEAVHLRETHRIFVCLTSLASAAGRTEIETTA
jgi:hypothetical protein